MLRPVTAIDNLSQPGHRTLIFENDEPGTTLRTHVHFPEDRGTLLYEDKIYDWYGREVVIDPRIKRILRPFGYSSDPSHNPLQHSDAFLVELKNNKLTIVELRYHQPENFDPRYIGTRLRATGQILNASPYLSIDDTVAIYDSISCDLIQNTCLRDLQHRNDYPLAAIGQLKNSEQYVFLSDHIFRSCSSRGWFVHHIVQSRDALIDFFTSPSQKFKKSTHPPSIFSTTELCNNLISLENGNKITAEFSYLTYRSSNIHASLDHETLGFSNGNHLYWYEDPAS